MARLNKKTPATPIYTANGAGIASRPTNVQQLRRLTMAAMLFEGNFYSDGIAHADALREAVANVKPSEALTIAEEARSVFNIRHAPLLIVREMARLESHKAFVADALSRVIQRPDELAEFLALYWKGDAKSRRPGAKVKTARQPLSAQVKKGLALALTNFEEFQLAKYANRPGDVSLRDVLFLTHAKPVSAAQAETFRKLAAGELKNEGTWESELSAAGSANRADFAGIKRATFERLMASRELGGMAFVMNLRNMKDAGVPKATVLEYARTANFRRVLPFRFIAAAKHVPAWEDVAETAMLRAIESQPKFPGKTVAVLDVSGSMGGQLSGRSEMTRFDAGVALMMLLQAMSEEVSLYATAGYDHSRTEKTESVRPRRGFALRDELKTAFDKLGGGGIFLLPMMDSLYRHEKTADRVIVITDEQDTGGRGFRPSEANAFGKENYIINVAAERNGIGYEKFTKIDGFSDAALKYIAALEGLYQQNTRTARV